MMAEASAVAPGFAGGLHVSVTVSERNDRFLASPGVPHVEPFGSSQSPWHSDVPSPSSSASFVPTSVDADASVDLVRRKMRSRKDHHETAGARAGFSTGPATAWQKSNVHKPYGLVVCRRGIRVLSRTPQQSVVARRASRGVGTRAASR